MNAWLCLCFALSGAGALGLELLWMRSAGLVLGTTAYTAATVVGAYFAGLAVGGFLARHAPARPVRRYARLELAAAAGALVSYGVFWALSGPAAQQALARAGLSGRVAVVTLTIVPVTLALGATLPTLCHALAAPTTVGPRGGALYALNTLGGVCGIAVMGFGLPTLLGVRASYVAAAAANALAGAVAIAIGDPIAVGDAAESPASRRAPERAVAAPALRAPERAPATPGVWVVAGGTGAVGIGLEILWTVAFAQVLHNSVYSFAAVSAVFLLALAAGAALSAWLLRFVAPTRVAAAALIVAGLGTVGGLWTFVHLTGGLRYFGMQTGLTEYLARIVVLAAVTAGPATVGAGAVLPALWAAVEDRLSAARPVGELTAVNLAGGIAGAALAAFVVLPWTGLRTGFLIAAIGYVLLAQAVASREASLRWLGSAAVLIIAVLDPMRAPLMSLNAGETLRATAEGAAGIVTVVGTAEDLQLRLDNYYVLGTTVAERSERRQGLLPLLLHPAPRRVAFIGMATGITASAAPALAVGDTTVVEVVPEVASMARAHFAPWNARLLERPDVRLVVDDGRRYLAAATAPFDVIVSDLFIPWHASAGNLYSREMYETVAARLAAGGLFCQWLPMYQLTREEFEVIARTFQSVFRHVTLWRNDFYPNRPVVGLVGARSPIAVDLERVAERLRGLPDWGRDSFLVAPRSMAMLYLGDLSLIPDLVARAPENRDDRPVIEFLAPRLTRMAAGGDKDWFAGAQLADFTELLARRLAGKTEPALPSTTPIVQARQAGAALFRYAIAATGGDAPQAERLMAEVSRLVPEVVASASSDAAPPALADVRRTLGALQSEQERLRSEMQSIEQRLRPGPQAGEHWQ